MLQQHANVPQEQICLDNFTCCHTETKAADQICNLILSQSTVTCQPVLAIHGLKKQGLKPEQYYPGREILEDWTHSENESIKENIHTMPWSQKQPQVHVQCAGILALGGWPVPQLTQLDWEKQELNPVPALEAEALPLGQWGSDT